MTQNKQRTQYDIMHPLFNALEGSNLTSTQRLLLIAIFRHIDGDGMSFPSYSKLQSFTGMSDRTISRNIKELVREGWITYEQGDKTKSLSNTYHINLKRLGFEVQTKVVPIHGFLAADGSSWACAADYWKSRQVAID